MNQIILRPDQFHLKNDVYNGWNSGIKRMLAVLPTGGGKSVVMSDIILDNHNNNANQIIMAHRTELVSQMSIHVAKRGIKHRLIAPKNVISQVIKDHRREFNGFSYINPTANCSVGGVDTINARKDQLKDWAAQQHFWFIDEAHHLLKGNKWGKCVEQFPKAFGLGVTATPSRADGCGLGDHADGVFHQMVQGPTMRQLINSGALCDYEIVCPVSDFEVSDDDFDKNGDMSPQKGRAASKRSHIVGDVVEEYLRYASGKKAIVFATDVETSNEIARKFNDNSISAAAVSAKTPGEVRSEYTRRFRDGRLTVLVNVDLFGEGFDVPGVEVVIMARPTASLGVYLQQFGRVLRVLAGKLFGLVIDLVSNWKRHGLPDKHRVWTLDKREKRSFKEFDPEDVPLKACTNCSRPYEKVMLFCPHCNHIPDVTTSQRQKIEQLDGDLMLLDRQKLEELRKATELPSPADIGQRVRFAAGEYAGKRAVNNQIERIGVQEQLKETIAIWAGYQRSKGRSDRESHKRFFHGAEMTVLDALALPKKDMETMINKIQGWL